MNPRHALLLVPIALFAACGSGSGDLSEVAIENAIENETGSTVDIDVDGEDGNIKITSDSGDVSYGSGSEVPDDFPNEVPLPNLTLMASISSSVTGGMGYALTYEAEDAQRAFEDYGEALSGDGFEVSDEYSGTANDQFNGAFSATKGGWKVTVVAFGGSDSPGTMTVGAEPSS